jgi:hypothetical protein
MSFRSIRLLFFGGAAMLACGGGAGGAEADSPYLRPVLTCVEMLMKEGTDRYGKEQSPMFSSVLDLRSHALPEAPPPLLTGQRPNDRAYPGANLQHDLHTLLLMPHLSEITRDPRFTQAADAYLEFFLRRCASAGNGLFPCGEHAFWDFRQEKVVAPIQEDLGHVPLEFWERAWRINPAAVEKHVRGLILHFMEGEGWVWNRHASIFGDKRPKDPAAFPRHGGFYVYQWTWLHTKTGDAQLLEWARKTSLAPQGLGHSVASLGISMLRANRIPGAPPNEDFEKRGRAFADRLIDPTKDRPAEGVVALFQKFGARTDDPTGPPTYGFWDLAYTASGGYGFIGAERIALNALSIHRLTGSEPHLRFAREVCEFYRTKPIPQRDGITPGKYAGILALALELYQIERRAEHLAFARLIADAALREFFAHGLVRAATGADYYEAANGPGLLLTELTRLHLILTGNPYPLPPSENDI